MIYITGDTHGDYTRFTTDCFPEQKSLTKDDFVIICGDFGIWNDSREQEYWRDWLEAKPFTTLFVDGNHENYDLLNSLPVKSWHGGKVHFVRPSIVHLMRGQLFDLNGTRIFTMGGAASQDIEDGILDSEDPGFKRKRALLEKQGKRMYRINHSSWWKEEMPDELEYVEARKTLDACAWKADFIVSHCGPSSVIQLMSRGFYTPDRLTDFLEEISRRGEFRYWFFGHYHEDRAVSGKYICLYEQILELPASALERG